MPEPLPGPLRSVPCQAVGVPLPHRASVTMSISTKRSTAPKVDASLALPALAIAGAVAVRIFFWAYTQRRYEDALITLTHAVNAVDGLGLTHHPGEGRVHGFTSAVSV